MSQERFWNYLDDDSTWRLNSRDLIVAPHGLYCGFDPILGAATMTLILMHLTTGVKKVDISLVETSKQGLWKSKQGVVVTEDASINLVIGAANVTNPRIDLIIGEHEYVQTAGGVTATYKVIQGTAAPSPVAPALVSPTKQVILGQLYVPANAADLAACTYTKAAVPDFAGNTDILHKSGYEVATGNKTFGGGVNFTAGSCRLVESDVVYGDDAIVFEGAGSYYQVIPVGAIPATTWYEITSIFNVNNSLRTGQFVILNTTQNIRWQVQTDPMLGGDIYQKIGETVILRWSGTEFLFVSKFNTMTLHENHFTQLQTFDKKGYISFNEVTGELILPSGNNFELDCSAVNMTDGIINKIRKQNGVGTTDFPVGTTINITFRNALTFLSLNVLSGTGNGSFNNPYTMVGYGTGSTSLVGSYTGPTYFNSYASMTVTLTMGTNNKWYVMGISNILQDIRYTNDRITDVNAALTAAIALKVDKATEAWHIVGAGGEPAFGANWSAAGGVSLRFKKNDLGIVTLSGGATMATGAGVMIFKLPSGYRPTQEEAFACPNNVDNAPPTVFIETGGNVNVYGITAGQSVYLSGINFYNV